MSLFVGAISGTSIDGLDLALVEVEDDQFQLVNAETVDFPIQLKDRLKELADAQGDVVDIGRTGSALGSFIGKAIIQFLENLAVNPRDVRAIGSHGQTIHHFPLTDEAFSMQIGDGARIAEITGIDTVVDFRSRDIAANGEGAPLVPLFHRRLFQSSDFDRVVLNIGGIANVSFLPQGANAPQSGFDTGPGNGLIDAYALKMLDKRFDEDGAIAATGSVDSNLFDRLYSDPWLSRPPPKSTGKEHFNLEYLMQAIHDSTSSPNISDVVATLTEFTARTICDAILRWCCNSGELVVCGGGRLNSQVMKRLDSHLSDFKVMTCDSLGVDGDSVEAATFAYLAHLFVERRPGNSPNATGASRERVLGCLYPG